MGASPQQQVPNVVTVSIYGPPGCGKTTLLRKMASKLDGWSAIEEDPADYPLVTAAVRPGGYAFACQLSFIARKVEQVLTSRPPIIIEMDWFAAHATWTPLLHQHGVISHAELETLNSIASSLGANTELALRGLVRIKGSGEEAAARRRDRSRSWEQNSSIFDALCVDVAGVDLSRSGVDHVICSHEYSDDDVSELCRWATSLKEPNR